MSAAATVAFVSCLFPWLQHFSSLTQVGFNYDSNKLARNCVLAFN